MVLRAGKGARVQGRAWARALVRADFLIVLLGAGGVLFPGRAGAQDDLRGTSIRDLPRRGYEPRDIRLGNTVVSIEGTASVAYDSNVFARPTARDDVVFELQPRVEATTSSGTSRALTRLYGNIREFAEHGRESSVAFGASTSGSTAFDRSNTLFVIAQYDRAIQSRADPERRAGIVDPPRKIDLLSSEIRFAHRGARFGFDLAGAVQRSDYLSRLDEDRDLEIYRGSLTGSISLPGAFDLFVEAYVNRRNFDLARDFSGVDRDATTYGLLIGGRRELSGRLRGRLGLGAFRSEPDDPTLRPFSGFAANGELTWSPRPRTVITFSAFSGDVATVRAGASGRTDTRLALRLDQEARHNLIFRVGAAFQDTSFRGASGQKQTTYSGEAEAEYLFNRHLSAFAMGSYTKRSADRALDRFKRAVVGLGVRFRY